MLENQTRVPMVRLPNTGIEQVHRFSQKLSQSHLLERKGEGPDPAIIPNQVSAAHNQTIETAKFPDEFCGLSFQPAAFPIPFTQKRDVLHRGETKLRPD